MILLRLIKYLLVLNTLCIFVIKCSATLNVLNKCFCDKNEVYINDTCVPQETYIAITDSRLSSPEEEALNTDKIPNIIIGDITCPEGTVKGNLYPEAFVLLQDFDGLLNKVNGFLHPQEQYCIEHLMEDGNLSWMAHACFNVTVPLCCPPKHIFDFRESNCVIRKDLNFNPQVHDSSSFFYEDSDVSGDIQILTCPENEKPVVKYIDSTYETALVFHKDGVKLSIDHQLSSLEYSDYCVGQQFLNNTQFYYANYCPQKDNIPTVRKCCQKGYVLDLTKKDCVPLIQNKTLLAFHDPVTLHRVPSPENFRLSHGRPSCELVLTDPNEYLLLLNGHVNIYNTILKQDEYCIDHMLYSNGTIETLCLYCLGSSAQVQDPYWVSMLKITCMFISCIFLTATLIVYLGVRELRKQLPSKCLTAEVFSLLLTFIITVITQSLTLSKSKGACMFMGVFGYIMMLSSFIWLNIICYDMCSSFTKVRVSQNSSRESIKRFSVYCLTAFGIPFILGMIALGIDLVPSRPQNWWLNKPGFEHTCTLYPDKSTNWIYLYSYMIISIVLNLYFFTKIALYLKRHHEETAKKFSSEGSATNKKDKDKLMLYVKLFIVMGITWIAEILSYESKDLGHHSIYYWLILDVINALRGLSIFIIFVCKRTTIKKIRKAWSPMLSKITGKSYDLESSIKTSGTNQTNTNNRKISNSSVQSFQTNSTVVPTASTHENIPMESISEIPTPAKSCKSN